MNTEDMRQHFESDGSPRRFDGETAGAHWSVGGGSTIFFGTQPYEILADLGGGWKLIAHPNGPAICNGDALSTIDIYEGESLAPRSVKLRAQEAFRKWAWPRLKAGLTFADRSNKNDVPIPATTKPKKAD